MKSIKADTLLLRKEPLETAATLMGEAKRVGPSHKRWTHFLESALESLYKAENLAASGEEQAVAQFGLGCAYLTLNELSDAKHWIDESVKSERQVLNAFLQKGIGIIDERDPQKDLPITWRDWTRFAYRAGRAGMDFYFLGVPALVRKITITPAKARIREQRVEPFRRFLHFANAAEVSADAIWRRPETKVLGLSDYDDIDEGYILSLRSLNWPPLLSLGQA